MWPPRGGAETPATRSCRRPAASARYESRHRRCRAVASGDLATCTLLTAAGDALTLRRGSMDAQLLRAAEDGDFAAVSAALAGGADVNAKSAEVRASTAAH